MHIIQPLPKFDVTNTIEVIERHKAGQIENVLQYNFLEAMQYEEYFVPASEMLKTESDKKLITLLRVEDSCKIIRQEMCIQAVQNNPYDDPRRFVLDCVRDEMRELSYVLTCEFMCWDGKPDNIIYNDALSASWFLMSHYDYKFVESYKGGFIPWERSFVENVNPVSLFNEISRIREFDGDHLPKCFFKDLFTFCKANNKFKKAVTQETFAKAITEKFNISCDRSNLAKSGKIDYTPIISKIFS